ncbi:MAG: exodeoxyribonuclease VII small subunit [Deltaproteobacteria bacterium]|nr:exodeoxyribonuclease VII small subunit [Deltaproteobacteria bacterium]
MVRSNEPKQHTFEEAMKRLEEIVTRLEGEEISLEESLDLFEEGVKLSRFCRTKLDEAEKRVNFLLKNSAGVLHKESLCSTGEDDAAITEKP